MVSIDQCTVRYLLTGKDPKFDKYIEQFRQFIYCDYNKGWLPEMIIASDDEFVWAYFAYPLSDVDRRLIQQFTMFELCIEEKLI